MIYLCSNCKQEFNGRRVDKRKFCSHHCYALSKSGKQPTYTFPKGHIPFFKGKKRPDIIGSNNCNWAGDKVSYGSIHKWVAYYRGRPQCCEHCGTTEKRHYHWANISGLYKRDLGDWMRLCVPCHKINDLSRNKQKNT